MQSQVTFVCTSSSVRVQRGADSWRKALIIVAFPRQSDLQSVSQSVSSLANPHSAFIINHRITLGRSVGWRGTSCDRICNCLHNTQQARYQALIWSTNIAWDFCTYYCQMMVAASGATANTVSAIHRTKSSVNKIWLAGDIVCIKISLRHAVICPRRKLCWTY